VVDNRLPAGQNTTSYAYDPNSNVTTVRYPNGLQSSFAYDNRNRVKALNSAPTGYSYQFGPTGNRVSMTEQSGRTLNWSYDGLYRLTNEGISNDPAGNNGTLAYGLDPVGNRLSLSSTLAGILSATETYNANDRLSTETYDNNGNVLTSGGKVFQYDFENRLKSMNGAVTLTYDGDGNRVAKSVGGVTTQYLVDDLNLTGLPQVVDEIVSGAVQRTYTYGLNRINESQVISGAWTPRFYEQDAQGNVRTLSDLTGTVTDTYEYDAFGNRVNATGSTPNNYLYRGEQFDPDLGLYYLRARYYNPVTGRFLTRDPESGSIDDPTTLSKYFYADADPVNKMDPTGRLYKGPQVGSASGEYATVLDIDLGLDSPGPGATIAAVAAISATVNCILERTGSTLALSHWAVSLPAGVEISKLSQTVCGVQGTATYLPHLPRRGTRDAPFNPEEEITNPDKGWRADPTGDFEGSCPAGSRRDHQKLHFDPGVSNGKGEHWDWTDCDGKTWYIWPDGSMSPAA